MRIMDSVLHTGFIWTPEMSDNFRKWAGSPEGKAEMTKIIDEMNAKYKERKDNEPVERARKANWWNEIKHIPFTI